MIITVAIMIMMQSPIHNVVNVIPVWHGLMTATRTVYMISAAMHGLATIGIGRTDFDGMFIVMVAVWIVQMPIVNIVSMVAMTNRGMSTSRTVSVFRVCRGVRTRHADILPNWVLSELHVKA